MNVSSSTKARMSRGVAWMAAFKVGERLIALLSMTVLARLLVPADFGLIVLATSMIGLLELLGAFNLETALIQQQDATTRHYDAVWTFNVLFAFSVAVIAAAAAPLAASLYGEPRLAAVIAALALGRAIGGLESTGPLEYRKELSFHREIAFLLAKRVATSLVVTIPLAFVLRSYWALVIGTVAGACISVALSYLVHPYRPRFSFSQLPQLMRFSRWLLLANILEFLHGRTADFLIGAWAGTPALGVYTAAREIARVPSYDVAAPVNRAVFPGYVKLAADRSELRAAYLRVTSIILLFVIPAATGLSVLAHHAVLILLGDPWLTAAPLVQLLAISGALGVLVSTGHHVNLAVGMSRSTTLVLIASLAISLPTMLVLVPHYGAAGAAMAALAASIVIAPFNLVVLARAIAIRPRDIVQIAWRPVVGSLAMAAALVWAQRALPIATTMPAHLGWAAVLVLGGALVYAAVVVSAWAVRRDAGSAESWLLRQLLDRQRGKRPSASISG